MPDHYEFRLLADFLQAAPLAANTRITPIPVAIGGELEQDERAEVVFAEIQPPIAAGLTDED